MSIGLMRYARSIVPNCSHASMRRNVGLPIVSGAAAFAARWRAIPLLRRVGELARPAPVLWAIGFVYRRLPIIQPQLQILNELAGA